ncbi:MAG: hypothetical protein RJA98_3406 [Pseudomonadota bacterium]|jgi:ketosteroid isomerase-like protein
MHTTLPPDAISAFLHAQVQAWNAGDREAFFAAYRQAAPAGLTIEYVGRAPATHGWPVLEKMWAEQSAKVEIEEVVMIVNGQDAAGHMRNKVRGTTMAIETMELYHFDAGHLAVRYFIRLPGA